MNYLETLKNISKDKKRKKENLILILVLLVILLISINYIFSDSSKTPKESSDSTNTNEKKNEYNDIESKISGVLSQISGVSEVSIIINYKDQGKSSIVYDTKETFSDDGNTTGIEKSVAYNEKSGEKTAIVQMTSTPEVEGVIVVAQGVQGSETKQKLSQALGTLLGIPSYRVQVFER